MIINSNGLPIDCNKAQSGRHVHMHGMYLNKTSELKSRARSIHRGDTSTSTVLENVYEHAEISNDERLRHESESF